MGTAKVSSATVVSVLRIPVEPSRSAEFVDRFVDLGIFARASEDNGMLSARLLASQVDPGEFVVTAEWPSSGAYQGWLDNPARERVNAELAPLLTGEMVGGLLVVAHEL